MKEQTKGKLAISRLLMAPSCGTTGGCWEPGEGEDAMQDSA